MSSPQLSAILPVYNVDPYLNQCLNSIQAQSFTEWEALLVDDGSTDFSGVICDNFARRDPRFKVIHQENAGVSAARNRGLEAAAGDLLAFIDPDDFVNECYFSELVSEMRRTDADVATSSVNAVSEDGSPEIFEIVNKMDSFIINMFANSALLNNQEVINALCNGLFSVSSWGKLFKHELWGNTLFPTYTDLGEDVATIPAVIAKASCAVCAPEAIYYYRQREKSLSHGSVDYQRLQKNLKASSVMLDKLRSLSPKDESRFNWIKFRCDTDALMEYLRFNPKAAKGKSKLFVLAQSVEDSGTVDVLTPLAKRLVGR